MSVIFIFPHGVKFFRGKAYRQIGTHFKFLGNLVTGGGLELLTLQTSKFKKKCNGKKFESLNLIFPLQIFFVSNLIMQPNAYLMHSLHSPSIVQRKRQSRA